MNIERELLSNIAAVASPEVSEDFIGGVMDAVDAAYERAKELREMFRAAAVEHIEATGRPLVIAGRTWVAVYPHETKNVPDMKRRTLHELLAACNGDVDAVADCLCADPYKPGHVKTILPGDVFGECFKTERKVRLQEKTPRKQLVQAWERQTERVTR